MSIATIATITARIIAVTAAVLAFCWGRTLFSLPEKSRWTDYYMARFMFAANVALAFAVV